MSYDITSISVRKLQASISAHDVVRLYELGQQESELPESCFLENLIDDARKLVGQRITCAACKVSNECDAKHCKHCGKAMKRSTQNRMLDIPLKDVEWCGEGSGDTIDFFKNMVVPCIKGEIHLIFTWEEGDNVSGLAIRDGKCVQCNVERKLILPRGW